MIQVGEKVEIDTRLTHVEHKEAIKEAGRSCLCASNDPHLFFTEDQNIPEELRGKVKDIQRFYELHYNEEGSILNSIQYWDHSHKAVKRMRRVGADDDCYFTKNNKKIEKREVTEWESNYGTPHVIWNRKKNPDSGVDVLPIQTKERKKKRFGIF